MSAREETGQSSVELVAMLPLLVVVGLGVAQFLAAGVGRELAEHAAENGAIALGQGEDPEQAVRDALPGWAAERVHVTLRGRQVRVRLTPVTVFPGAGEVLATDARADAGPDFPVSGTVPAGAVAPSVAAGSVFGAVTEPTRDEPAERASER